MVNLHNKTVELMQAYTALAEQDGFMTSIKEGNHVAERSVLIRWLLKDESQRPQSSEANHLRQKLYAAVYKDMLAVHKPITAIEQGRSQSNNWLRYGVYGFLASAGVLQAFCDGFNGIVTVTESAFLHFPALLNLALGTVFSLLSAAVYIGFDLVVISENLGVDWQDASETIDAYTQQTSLIAQLTAAISSQVIVTRDIRELSLLRDELNALKCRYAAYQPARVALTASMDNNFIHLVRAITTTATGVLYFSTGFFSGQSMALIVAGLVATSPISAAAWPVILTAALTGMGAFGNYWFLERPGLEELVGRWFGIDKAKIDAFCAPEQIARQDATFEELESQIVNKISAGSALGAGAKMTLFGRERAWSAPDWRHLSVQDAIEPEALQAGMAAAS